MNQQQGPCVLVATLLILTLPAAAQRIDLGFKKGDQVAIAVPFRFATVRSTGWAGQNTKLDFDARIENGAVELLSPSGEWSREWRLAGFPSLGRYEVGNIKTVDREDKGKGKWIEVTLKISKGYDYRFFSPVDQPAALRALLAPAAAADSIRVLAYDSLGQRFFVGPLAGFSATERVLLLSFAHVTAQGTRISSETYKSVVYLVVTLPGDGNTWNDLVVNRSKRVGRLIGEQLPLLKGFAKVAVPHDAIGGLKLEQPSRHGTAPDYANARDDHVAAYVPMDALLRFADADITSQELVNRSIVLVNDDRVEVDLSTQ